jgi:hypothetical protein
MKNEIGEAAGKIWNITGKEGKITLSRAKKITGCPDLAHMAIGWLAREEKIDFVKEGRATYITLTEEEKNIYKQQSECK